MSGIGFSELIILFLIGLIVLGPERLPRVANQLGSWIGQARRMTRVMKRQLEDELTLEKTPDIMPPKSEATSSEPEPETVRANEDDDSFSPAHDADAVGSGVNDDLPEQAPTEHRNEVGDDEGVEAPEEEPEPADPEQPNEGSS